MSPTHLHHHPVARVSTLTSRYSTLAHTSPTSIAEVTDMAPNSVISMRQASVKPSSAFQVVGASPSLTLKCAPAVSDQVVSSMGSLSLQADEDVNVKSATSKASPNAAVTKANPWDLMTNTDFNMKKGKLHGQWNFNDLLGLDRPDFSAFGQYKSFRSGPQNDSGWIGAAFGQEWRSGGGGGGGDGDAEM